MSQAVKTSLEGDIFLIEIDNPPVNAASVAVRTGVVDAIAAFEAETSAKAAVLYCAGRTFVAGADIKEFGRPRSSPSCPTSSRRSRTRRSPSSPSFMAPPLVAVSNSRSAAITASA